MKNILSILLLFIFLQGCKKENVSNSSFSEETIDFTQVEKVPLNNIPDSLLGKKHYILLEETNEKVLFGNIHKILCKNNHIYILDKKMNKLVIYDMAGYGIGLVGQFGQGPEEYLDIADFDVDKDGSIYCIDGRQDKLFSYSPDLRVSSVVPLPFEVDILQITDNGFLFGLSQWNHKECKGSKIVLVDKQMKIQKMFLEYDEYFDPAYWISFYQFVAMNDYIVYNQPIDNHIYLFNPSGKLEKCINIDFGDMSVPNEDKKDIERNMNKFDNYCLLRDFVVVTDYVIAGALWEKRNHIAFIYDKNNNICYHSDRLLDTDTSWATGYSDGNWITYIDSNADLSKYNSLPDSVMNHLNKEGFVLCLQALH